MAILFSAGDGAAVEYPSASRNVLSVGATNLTLSGGNYGSESGWTDSGGSGGGGGLSQYGTRPPYQNGVSAVVGTKRGTPDVAMLGGTGGTVNVYSTYPAPGGWSNGVYGTSLSCPCWAGLVGLVDQGRALAGLRPLNTPLASPAASLTSYQLQTNLYALWAAHPGDFHDVIGGTNSYGQSAVAGYDLLTGLGSPVADLLVPDLVGYTTTSPAVATPAPTAYGAITLTASVGGKSVTPTGTVTFLYGATALGTAPLSGGTATLPLATSPLPAGVAVITAVYSGDANYATSTGAVSAAVGRAASGTTAGATLTTVTSGNSDTLTATVTGVAGHTPTGAVTFLVGAAVLGTVTLTGGSASLPTTALPIGSPTVVTAVYAGDSDYAASSGTVNVTVAAVTLTVTPRAGQSMVYGAAVPALTFDVSGLASPHTAADVLAGALHTTATSASGAGTYTIDLGTLHLTGSSPSGTSYQLTFAPGGVTVAVTPATLHVAADPGRSKVYGAAVPALTYTVTAADLVNGDGPGVVTGAPHTTATAASPVTAGGYPIDAGTLTAGANYAISFTGSAFLVTPAPLHVAADPGQSKVYGDPLPGLTYTLTLADLVNGDTTGVVSGRLHTTATPASPVIPAGYPIDVGTLTAGPNYTLAFTGSSFAVTPAPLHITADPGQSKVYGAAVPALAYTVTTADLKNGDTAGVVTGRPHTTATDASPVTAGGYPIDAGTLAAGGNYTLAFAEGTFLVTPAPLTVAARPVSKVYGAALPALTFTASGLVNGDTPDTALTGALATTATPAGGVGTYPITRGTLAAANYAITFAGGTLTVTPAPLTVVADDKSGLSATTLPTLTYTVAGLINGDGPGVVTGVSVSTPATLGSVPGTYPILVSGGTAANYVVTALNGPSGGVLTLTPSVPLLGSTGFAAGTDAGASPSATLYTPGGGVQLGQVALDPAFAGGVRVAVADFNADGTPDLVVGTGPGGPTLVRVLDGRTGSELARLRPFEPAFTGGVYVTTGALGAAGRPALIVTPDEGGGPRVEVFDLTDAGPVLAANFFGIDDPNFRGGARAAVGDLNGDGTPDLVVAAGFGGGPRVSAYDGTTVGSGQPAQLFDVFVFEQTLRNGVFVTAGDVNGDGFADLVVGGGPGGGPRVEVFSGADLARKAAVPAVLANFFAGSLENRGGVRVAAKNLDGDTRADLVVGDGTGAGSRVTAYYGKNLSAGAADLTFDAAPGFAGGVFVG